MKEYKKVSCIVVSLVIIAGLLLVACNGDDEKTKGNGGGNGGGEIQEDVVITIGNISDFTSVAANSMTIITKALKDTVGYYNDENLIPGVKLKVVDYDNQYDPTKDLPGYNMVRQKGADLIWTPCPPTVMTLKSAVSRDEFPLFAATANMNPEELDGGYAFSLGITPRYEALTMLEWLVENDSNFPQDRPAKIGGASWTDGYSEFWFRAMEDYAEAHPDLYEFVGGYQIDFTFIWTTQVEALKDCDYVFTPIPPQAFIKQYREAGHEARFLWSDVAAAFLGMIDNGDQWDEIDGTKIIRSSRWYNETGKIIDITNGLLDNNYSASEAESIRRNGCGYIAVKQVYLMLDIVRQAADEVGPENLDSKAIYDAATRWTFGLDGIEDFNNLDPTKRRSQNYYAIYEAVAEDTIEASNIHRITDWIPQVTKP